MRSETYMLKSDSYKTSRKNIAEKNLSDLELSKDWLLHENVQTIKEKADNLGFIKILKLLSFQILLKK
jgi:hypothetical protein